MKLLASWLIASGMNPLIADAVKKPKKIAVAYKLGISLFLYKKTAVIKLQHPTIKNMKENLTQISVIVITEQSSLLQI